MFVRLSVKMSLLIPHVIMPSQLHCGGIEDNRLQARYRRDLGHRSNVEFRRFLNASLGDKDVSSAHCVLLMMGCQSPRKLNQERSL